MMKYLTMDWKDMEGSCCGLSSGTILAYAMKSLSQDGGCPGQDLNWSLSENKSEALLLEPTYGIFNTAEKHET
jgi:hypothetical protein